MSDIKSTYSDYVRFTLQADNSLPLVMNQEPIGWEDDNLELDRHKQHYGIFVLFSNKLEFTGDEKDYILNNYKVGGVNANLRLTKQILRNVTLEDGSSDVKWFERYSANADYNTLQIDGNKLQIKFNSNDLAEILKSHEGDDFEIERKNNDSIDGVDLGPVDFLKITTIKGREIAGTSEQVIDFTTYELDSAGQKFQRVNMGDNGFFGVRTTVTSQGSSVRWSSVTLPLGAEYLEANPTNGQAIEGMCFTDDTIPGITTNITLQWHFKCILSAYSPFDTCVVVCDLVRYRKLDGVDGYEEVEVVNLVNETGIVSARQVERFGIRTYTDLAYNEGLAFRWRASSTRNDGGNKKVFARFYDFTVTGEITDFFETSNNITFMFVHDLFERLLQIYTGEKYRFYSKYFGRTELLDEKGVPKYVEDGKPENEEITTGLIGIISGYWLRAFDQKSDKYKSLTISWTDLMDSVIAVFNVGMGIETVDFKERVRIEDRKYFFRNEVVIRLPYQISKVKRRVSADIFNSGIEIGYELGGDYENEIGLDEPNTITKYVTPIRKSKNKYIQKSKVRADDYGMELVRRKPQALYPDEDTAQDDHNWFLDMVRDDVVYDSFSQAEYQDRMEVGFIPTGIHSPKTFKSMIFTPLRMLFRHGWNIRSGLEPYYNKYVKYISSKQNSTLTMQFPGEPEYTENTDILVNDLERSRYLPEEIEFEHPVDDELIDKIFGTTEKLINGSKENVPNFYFKFEWINENEEVERGYLMNFKPKGIGKFKMLVANENLIKLI